MPEFESRVRFGSLTALLDEIDDFCGTKPPRKFPPKPHGVRDVLISVAIHDLASNISDTKLRDQIQNLAGQTYVNAGKSIAG